MTRTGGGGGCGGLVLFNCSDGIMVVVVAPTPSGCCVSVLRLLVLIEVALYSCRKNLFLYHSICGTWSYVSWGLSLFIKSHKRFDDSLSSERGSDILIARNIDR